MAKNDYSQRAEWYDFELSTNEDSDFILSLIDTTVNSILEIPCGSGRNVPLLASTKREIVFVDAEKNMIEKVNNKIEQSALSNCNAYVGQIECFKLDRKFDLILIPLDAFLLVPVKKSDHALKNLKTLLSAKLR